MNPNDHPHGGGEGKTVSAVQVHVHLGASLLWSEDQKEKQAV